MPDTKTLTPTAQPMAANTQRRVALRTRGHGHGFITRLMSPSDLGQVLKPFVFLDIFDADRATIRAMASGGGMPIHPHSGVATVTVFTEGQMLYDDPAIGSGSIAYGGVEWMRAGGGMARKCGRATRRASRASSSGLRCRASLKMQNQKAAISNRMTCGAPGLRMSSSAAMRASKAPCPRRMAPTTCLSPFGPASTRSPSLSGQDTPRFSPARP